jgi:hypothetical protein
VTGQLITTGVLVAIISALIQLLCLILFRG